MGRQRYYLKKRGRFFYYYLSDDPKKLWKSTGCKKEREAIRHVDKLLEKGDVFTGTLRQYAEPFFRWDRCPHCTRFREDGKQISPEHAQRQRRVLEKYVFSDPLIEMRMGEIRKGDIQDYRSRLIKRLGVDIDDKSSVKGKRALNSVMVVLSTIFNEGIHREELDRNPAAGLTIGYHKLESGVFTQEELKNLFPEDSYGPWDGILDFTLFITVATLGLRRGEALALKWKHINLEKNVVTIEEARKSATRTGRPKWDKIRTPKLPARTRMELLALREESIRIAEDDYVFCWDDGSPVGTQFWKLRFRKAMRKTGIDTKTRRLSPHSFRHTLATILRDQGSESEKIRSFLGWSSQAMLDHYTHYGPEHLEETANLIDEIF